MRIIIQTLCFLFYISVNVVSANDVTILAADLQRNKDDNWSINVTLEHADSGWEHYADEWRIVDSDGNVLGSRVLLHPHDDEQPFTRGLTGVALPSDASILYIEAHDLIHGWTPKRLQIDMNKSSEGRMTVTAE